MFRQSVTFGRIFGIPLKVDYSWLLIFGLITWTLATGYFPGEYPHWLTAEYWFYAFLTSLLFFGSVLFHELGHSVLALHYKVPVRGITLFIFGGVSELRTESPSAWAELWIALAGPFGSFILALFFGLFALILPASLPLEGVSKYMALINALLGASNLIPGFPLDGGRALRAILWGVTHNFRKATRIAATVGQSFALLFIVFGIWQMFSGNFINGLWIAFIGWFLDSAATSQLQQQALQDLLQGHLVLEAMSRSYVIISPDTTLQEIADDHILGMARRFFIVKDASGNICGLFTPHHMQAVPKAEWAQKKVSEVMIPAEQMHWVSPETDLWDALQKMDRDGVNQQPVLLDNQLQGILSRDGIISFLRTAHR